MRDLKVRRRYDCIAVKQNVDIDRAWAFPLITNASQSELDLLQWGKQLLRKKAGFDFDNQVKKPGLIRKIARLGLIDGRGPQYSDVLRRQAFQGACQENVAISGVRS